MQTCPSVFGTLATLLTSYFVLNGHSKYYLVDAKVEGLKFNGVDAIFSWSCIIVLRISDFEGFFTLIA